MLDEIDHIADRAFRIRGSDMRELFTHAALGLFRLQDQHPCQTALMREIAVQGIDRETLLVNWLNEILYLQETCEEMYVGTEILEISDQRLRARLFGVPDGRGRNLIKAVTFYDLRIEEIDNALEATVTVDV